MAHLGPEFLPHAAVDDEVDRGVDHDEEVVKVDEDVERHWDVVGATVLAEREVDDRVILGMRQLVEAETQSVRVADDKDEHDGNEDDGGLLAAPADEAVRGGRALHGVGAG